MNVALPLDFGPVTGFRVGHALVSKPWMTVICYRVDDVLIDTGPHNARTLVQTLVQPESLQGIYLTHYHEDHAGNAGYLQERFGIPVYGHPLTAKMLRQKIKLKPYEHYMWGALDTVQVLPQENYFTTENYRFEIIHTPGHSHDHVIFWEKNQGWLFSGDMYLGARIKYFRSDEDIYQTIASLKTIAALDFASLFCGHNPQLVEPRKAIQRKIDHLENIIGHVQRLHDSGLSRREIVRRAMKGRESWLVRMMTLGDVSYRHMILSVLQRLA